MERRIVIGFACFGVMGFCLGGAIGTMQAQSPSIKTFPAPADPYSVRMEIIGAGHTLEIIVPKGQGVSTRDSMDKLHTVIDINLAAK